MNVSSILTELRARRKRLDAAISALEGVTRKEAPKQAARVAALRGQRRFSAATRKRMSEVMKQRWAARKKAGKSRL